MSSHGQNDRKDHGGHDPGTSSFIEHQKTQDEEHENGCPDIIPSIHQTFLAPVEDRPGVLIGLFSRLGSTHTLPFEKRFEGGVGLRT